MAEFETEKSSVGEKKILFEDPMIYTIDNFVTKEECEHFVNTARPKLQRALVSDKSKGMYSKGRTGSNAWLRHEHDEITTRVGKRIAEQINIPFTIGESVKVIDGPFNGFTGSIDNVNEEKRKLEVMVKIFGRKTPLELSYMQVEKL